MGLVSETQPEPFPLHHTKNHENNRTEIPHGQAMHAFCLSSFRLTLKFSAFQTLKPPESHTTNSCCTPTKTQKKNGVTKNHPFIFLSTLTIKLT